MDTGAMNTGKKTSLAAAQDMQAKAARFLEFQRKYYRGEGGDRELAELVTQPYWQSMRLSKKRLAAKGLTMDTTLQGERRVKAGAAGRLEIEKDGANLIGVGAEPVVANKSFHSNGKIIYTGKEHAISTVSLLKGDVDGEYAACPNCGHVGRLDSYTDGCDACGARFSVTDFETKVSGFSLEENAEKQIKGTVDKTLKGLGIFTAVLMGLGILLFIFLFVRFTTVSGNEGMLEAMLGWLMAIQLVIAGLKGIVSLAVIYILLTWLLVWMYRRPVVGAEIVKQVLPDFSAQDFFQNLEYKLRNIHLTDRAEEVSAFASCALEEFVAGYGDVVDCSMTRLKFISARKTEEGYVIEAEAKLKLTKFRGSRIRIGYEKVRLALHGKHDVVRKRSEALREYKCPGCGTSINILEGSTCPACSSVFDYGDYGWVIQHYSSAGRQVNLYSAIRGLIVTVYVLVMAFHFVWLPAGNSMETATWGGLYQKWQQQFQELMDVYDSVLMPDEISADAVLISFSDDIVSRQNVYAVSDASAVADEYLQQLVREGWQIYPETGEDGTVILYWELQEPLANPDDTHLKVSVATREGKIQVLVETANGYGE